MKKTNIKVSNHMMPFLWVHGEEEQVYREMVKAIDEANIKAFCVESRPHDDFLGPTWWRDMDILIDEAKKRGMGIYILDDKHFPTGFANGAALKAPNHLRRQSIFCKTIPLMKGQTVSFSSDAYDDFTPTFNTLGAYMDKALGNEAMHFDDDRLLSATFVSGENLQKVEIVNDVVSFTPQEDGVLALCYLTRNAGIHRSYINMLQKESVKLLIDEVYEKHFEHYKNEFGKTILGFFSDEPEIGNSSYTNRRVDMGDDPNLDLPWSLSLEEKLDSILGKDYANLLPLLWLNGHGEGQTSHVRYEFMKAVTDLVSESFSKQIGEWCRRHRVNYIGHVIEDNNLHSKTCSSLGHYFKGLKYQSMAGVDDIGGQVLPQKEDEIADTNPMFFRDGEFYHYTLAKLATSLASYDPVMHGDSMCEIFGNYGWQEGLRLEKYLLDHFMVRGVNHFVPHAFTCKAYPDPDCPPHFYAFGHNPEYRHFGKLMAYGNRVCSLLSNGKIDAKVGILYHAESEWCGKTMLIEKPAKALYDHQIDYLFVPSEAFEDLNFYHTEYKDGYCFINGNELDVLIVPECERIPESVASLVDKKGIRLVFINSLPKGTCEGRELKFENVEVATLENLPSVLDDFRILLPSPQFRRLRAIHYWGENECYFIANEESSSFDGDIRLPKVCDLVLYDPWDESYEKVDCIKEDGSTLFHLHLDALKSIVILVGSFDAPKKEKRSKNRRVLDHFDISIARAKEYPRFISGEPDEKFSGYIRYETSFDNLDYSRCLLKIENAYEGVEVFINGVSLGIQIVPPFVYDLKPYLKDGKNNLTIEVASTLYRERGSDKSMAELMFGIKEEKHFDPLGIVGDVVLFFE